MVVSLMKQEFCFAQSLMSEPLWRHGIRLLVNSVAVVTIITANQI